MGGQEPKTNSTGHSHIVLSRLEKRQNRTNIRVKAKCGNRDRNEYGYQNTKLEDRQRQTEKKTLRDRERVRQ